MKAKKTDAIGFVALAVFVAVPLVARAQVPAGRPEPLPTSAALEAKLEAIRVKYGVPALGAAATTGEKLLVVVATGFRKKGAPERVTIYDRWHLGSCTKSMTATMLARLVERRKLHWDSTIGGIFKELAESGKMNEAYRPVTLEELLAHRGGIPGDVPEDLWGRLWERKGTPTDQRQQLLRGIMSLPPASKPGTAYIYSNAGVAIAGHMAEHVIKKPWEEVMREEMFNPLGMKDVGFGAPGEPGRVIEPWGHTKKEGKPVEPGPNADNPPAIGPAATINASLADWAKYAAMHLRGARGKTDYLMPETFTRIQAHPKEGSYAFGWDHASRPWGNGDVLTHGGSNNLWESVIWVAPDRDVAYLAACNSAVDGAARANDEAIQALMEAVKGEIPPLKR